MTELEKILDEIGTKIVRNTGRKREGLLEAESIIRKYLTEKDTDIHSNDGWIPVEERMPEEGEMVLVTCQKKSGQRSVNRAWHMGGFWHGTGSMSEVIAWRPLPEPYRPEKP